MSSPHLLTSTIRRRAGVLAAAAATLAAAAALPAAADASTVSLDGDVLVVRGAPGEPNYLNLNRNQDQPSKLQIGDIAAPTAYPSLCAPDEYSYNVLTCSVPSGGVRLDAGDGVDVLHVGTVPAGTAVVADGGAGNDTLRGTARDGRAAARRRRRRQDRGRRRRRDRRRRAGQRRGPGQQGRGRRARRRRQRHAHSATTGPSSPTTSSTAARATTRSR